MPREALLARSLVELADNLVEDFDIVELLTLLCDRCVEVLDVAAAGLMLASPAGDLAVMAYSSDAMRLLEVFELETQEGPCVDSFRTGVSVINQDLAATEAKERWPRLSARARGTGFDSVHALPMRLRGHHDRRFQPVPNRNRSPRRGRRSRRPGIGRRRHHHHPPAPRGSRRQRRQRPAHPGALQPRRHRAGQRGDRRIVLVSAYRRRSNDCGPTPAATTFD